jgi:hypothetical protein
MTEATTLTDVVNFNADASCLEAGRWLAALVGGAQSEVCSWLRAYVELERPVTLGLTGGTVCDLARHNPEAIALVNAHPDVFEMVLRPFSHDVALLRTRAGFLLNFELGARVLRQEFGRVTPFWLPPEFMLTNEQVALLADRGVDGVFINSRRFSGPVAAAVPRTPYRIRGIFDKTLACLPLAGELTAAYLEALHAWSAAPWTRALACFEGERTGVWRDGESWLLLPGGLARERAWLAGEPKSVRRVHVSALAFPTAAEGGVARDAPAYPLHSFARWVREFRMLGYLRRLDAIEARVTNLPLNEAIIWLQAINSDVLSAVEKEAPCVRIATLPAGTAGCEQIDHVIPRSPRGLEGEEYLVLVEQGADDDAMKRYLRTSNRPHVVKLRGRVDYFS